MLIIRLHSRTTHVFNLAFSAPALQLSLSSEYGAQVLRFLLNLITVFLLLPLICFAFPAEAVGRAETMTCVCLFSGIEKDAVTIFTRFISPDAVRPIPITEQIRNDIVGRWPFSNLLSFVWVESSSVLIVLCSLQLRFVERMAWWTQTALSLHSQWSQPSWRISEFLSFLSPEKLLVTPRDLLVFFRGFHFSSFHHFTSHTPTFICPACSFTCRHFSEFLRSHHYCKYQIEVLTSGSVFLADILFCESALFYFSEVSGPHRGPQTSNYFCSLQTETLYSHAVKMF